MPTSVIASLLLLRSLSNCDLVVPRTSRKIGVAAPRAWNRLPTDLKLLRSTASFKSKLKSFLFHAAYSGNTVNSGMCHRSDCRGCTTSHCCYCYCMCVCSCGHVVCDDVMTLRYVCVQAVFCCILSWACGDVVS